jgi:hypothetical protein
MFVIARIKESKMHSDKEHAMSSHKLQSAMTLTLESSKIYYTK